MKITVKKIDFERNKEGKVPFNKRNIYLLKKYVLPIISNNIGWSTGDLTIDGFLQNPEKWRIDIDATVENDPNGEVYIAMDGDKPVGLLEYVVEDFTNLSEKDFSEALNEMVTSKDSRYWKSLENYNFFDKDLLLNLHKEIKPFLYSKRFYKFVGVVVLPELQGKKSGVSDVLYAIMKNGFIFGWTSTPQAIAKRRKLYSHTLFFPLLNQKIKNLEDLVCVAILTARIYSRYPKTLENFKFGVKTHEEFAERDKKDYMELTKSFLNKKKVDELDYKRLDYILDFNKAQGAIISIN